jgi:hypothetical protein
VVRKITADATAAFKRNAKAVVQGIWEGWMRDDRLDVNHASKAALQRLPGISPRMAEQIVANRPYSKPGELVSKRVLSKSQYERIADRLTAKS